ncbi:MAG: hypothetical protein JWM75_1508 [Sphingomonas bacterium]|nr:hypothetical protein [Sphingomonas bacterium]
MSATRSSRWLISFADLCLLLLGFFVLLHARDDSSAAVASVRQSLGGRAATQRHFAASSLFEAGEAVFRPGARRTFRALGARAASAHSRVRIESIGVEPATARFDGWELAAARAAALGRAIAEGGLAPDRIEIAIPATRTTPRGGQQLSIEKF